MDFVLKASTREEVMQFVVGRLMRLHDHEIEMSRKALTVRDGLKRTHAAKLLQDEALFLESVRIEGPVQAEPGPPRQAGSLDVTCATCAAWRQSISGWGTCHARPPSQDRADWPKTTFADFCMSWTERK